MTVAAAPATTAAPRSVKVDGVREQRTPVIAHDRVEIDRGHSERRGDPRGRSFCCGSEFEHDRLRGPPVENHQAFTEPARLRMGVPYRTQSSNRDTTSMATSTTITSTEASRK